MKAKPLTDLRVLLLLETSSGKCLLARERETPASGLDRRVLQWTWLISCEPIIISSIMVAKTWMNLPLNAMFICLGSLSLCGFFLWRDCRVVNESLYIYKNLWEDGAAFLKGILTWNCASFSTADLVRILEGGKDWFLECFCSSVWAKPSRISHGFWLDACPVIPVYFAFSLLLCF